MEPFDRSKTPSGYRSVESSVESEESHGSSRRRKKQRTPQSYRVCDWITEGLIYWMVIFTPWAFGTTQPWSIWTMNISAYALGALLLTKWIIRWRTGYKPSRWGEKEEGSELISIESTSKVSRALIAALAVLTGLILLYILISALNPRAIYYPSLRRFEYRDYIPWLPHSYDPAKTWQIFWMYLGLACAFWSIRDWLIGSPKMKGEQNGSRSKVGPQAQLYTRTHDSEVLPPRLRRLLWILCINGGILALEGILQRLSSTNKLLWLVEPRINKTPDVQFGPYAYRSNAATYFNMVWPVCLAFWLILRRETSRGLRVGGGNYLILLPWTVLMAAAPIISTARGGALIAFGNIFFSGIIVFWHFRHESFWTRFGFLSLFIVMLTLGGSLGWKSLEARLKNVFNDQLSLRTVIYQNAEQISEDLPTFGTGPGTFGTIYQLYMGPTDIWEAYAHNDWLETRVTFGLIGFGLVSASLFLVFTFWMLCRLRILFSQVLDLLLLLSLFGCLVHARFDFPFQIYSLIFLFLLLCTIPFCLDRKRLA